METYFAGSSNNRSTLDVKAEVSNISEIEILNIIWKSKYYYKFRQIKKIIYNSQVVVQFIKPCEGLLQLTDVVLLDQDENYPVERAEKFIHALSLHDLRYEFYNHDH